MVIYYVGEGWALKMNIEKPKSKIGELPGSITYTGEDRSNEIKIELIAYDSDSYTHEQLDSVDDLNLEKDDKLKWIKVIGLNNSEVIEKIGDSHFENDNSVIDVFSLLHQILIIFFMNIPIENQSLNSTY